MSVVERVEITITTDPFDLSNLAYGGGSALATLAMSDGGTEHFTWFHDELTFVEKDFIGKTMQEIRDLHRERDLQYLRS